MERLDDSLPPFAFWLRRQIKRRGWSGAELARRAEVSPAAATRWLNGVRQPREGEHIRRLAEALQVHQDEVLEQLDFRDGGADHMSLAVRRLSPVIDRYDWTEEALEQLAQVIDSVGKMHAGTYEVPHIKE